MVNGFDIELTRKVSGEALKMALAAAYAIESDDIDLQYQGSFDFDFSQRKLFCLVNEDDSEFPVLLTLSFDTEFDVNIVVVASSLSKTLGCDCVIPSGSLLDDDTRLLVRGFEDPKLVIYRETYDPLLGRNRCYLEDY